MQGAVGAVSGFGQESHTAAQLRAQNHLQPLYLPDQYEPAARVNFFQILNQMFGVYQLIHLTGY